MSKTLAKGEAQKDEEESIKEVKVFVRAIEFTGSRRVSVYPRT